MQAQRRVIIPLVLLAFGVGIGWFIYSRLTSPEVEPETPLAQQSSPTEPVTPEPATPPTETEAVSPEVETPEPVAPIPIKIIPEKVQLTGPGDRMQFLVLKQNADGSQEDITQEVTWRVESDAAELLKVSEHGAAEALASGSAKLIATLDSEEVATEIEIGELPPPASDFALDIVPILTKSGCNGGQCHGAAQGKGGFNLSLFGYDPEPDYDAITLDLEGRRLDPVDPSLSLLLLKPTMEVPHEGRLRLEPESPEYEKILRWIAFGAPYSDENRGRLTKILVSPSDGFLRTAPSSQQLRVVAHYDDGSKRDVTRLCVYASNDSDTVSVSKNGLAKMKRRGQADVVVRYANKITTVRLAAPFNDSIDFDYETVPSRNMIDRTVVKNLQRMRLPVSERTDDESFLRRLCFDLIGHMPNLDVSAEMSLMDEFLESDEPDKRDKLIDILLEKRDFVKLWTKRINDLLQVNSQLTGNVTFNYYIWLDKKLTLEDGKSIGYDELVRELLTAEGSLETGKEHAPAVYYAANPDPTIVAEQVARRFLGLRIGCAKCHDHPLDVWTQDDYYGFASIFGGLRINMADGSRGVQFVSENRVRDPRTEKTPDPRVLTGDKIGEESENSRHAMVDWMLSEENPWFARMAVNWVWANLMGRGLVEPVDDLRATNPAVIPELLDQLAESFRESGFDLRSLIRTIVQSETYQRTSLPIEGNEQDESFYSHALLKPLNAQQIADSITQVTRIPTQFDSTQGSATRALDLPDPTANYLLEVLGQCDRTAGCNVGRLASPFSLRQALHLIIGDAINNRLRRELGEQRSITVDMASAYDDWDEEERPELIDAQINTLYMRAYCRKPRSEESEFWKKHLTESDDYSDGLEDMIWAMLNSREFSFNR